MSDHTVLNIICIQTNKQLTILNNIQVLLKSVLTDLYVHNFVNAKTSWCARCMYAYHHVRSLSSPDSLSTIFNFPQFQEHIFSIHKTEQLLHNHFMYPCRGVNSNRFVKKLLCCKTCS